MAAAPTILKKRLQTELALFLILLLVGLLLLPISIYLVGDAIFGDYSGSGFAEFYQSVHDGLRRGDSAIWFLVLSPYLGWQVLRLTVIGFRHSRNIAPH
jgi:hypothetical protein